MTQGSLAMTSKKSPVDCSRLPVIHCCASIQASTLTAHIQQGDVLVSVNGISLVTYGHNETTHKSAEEIINILKLAKSPKKVRFLRLIRSTGDLLSRGSNAADVQLDAYESSLLNDNVKRSKIPKFVVTRSPAGKMFDPISSSLFDVVFSYQASLGIRVRSCKLNRWKEAVKEKSITTVTSSTVPVVKETPSPTLSIAMTDRDSSQDDCGSNSSGSPSVFSSSSLWKLFECEEELYQSHCYFSGELLKEDAAKSGDSTRITTAETTPARTVNCESSSCASSELASPASAAMSPRTDTQDPFILTYPETYMPVTEKQASKDLIPPPKVTEVPFFTNPMPAAASKMVRMELRRSSDSRAFNETTLRKTSLQTLITHQEEKFPQICSDNTSRSSLSVSPLSSVGKSVSGEPNSPRFIPQFSPDPKAPPRVLTLEANYPNISTGICSFEKKTGTSSTILRSDAFNVAIQSPSGQSIRCPPTGKSHEALSPDLISYKISLKNALKVDDEQKELPETGKDSNMREIGTDEETELLRLKQLEERIAAEMVASELAIVKEELCQLQKCFAELTEVHEAEVSRLSAELAEAKEVAKYLAGDVLDMQTEKDREAASRVSSERRATLSTDAERLMEVERKIQNHVLSRMVDLDDTLSQSSSAVTVQYVHDGRDLATRTSCIRREESVVKEEAAALELPVVKQSSPLTSEKVSVVKQMVAARESVKENTPAPVEKMSLVKQMVAARESAAAEAAGQNQRNIDYQATKNKLGLGALGAPVNRLSVSQYVPSPADGPSKTAPKAVDLTAPSRRRSSRGSIRNSLSSGGETNNTERPPWWRVR
jgi:hypothetical protein